MMVEASMWTPGAILHKQGHYVQVISDRRLTLADREFRQSANL